MACNLTKGQPKPQLASQRLSGEKAIETTQSFSLGNLKTMCSDFTSQIETCRSSPPEAKKRESEDQTRQRTPAAHESSETTSKCLSTSKIETLPDSPPTAKTFPEGEKAEVCSKSEKSMDATSGHSAPLWGTCQAMAVIPLLAVFDFTVIKPCMSSDPPHPAKKAPLGEKQTLRTSPQCCSRTRVSRPGTDIKRTFLVRNPTANNSRGLDVMANESTPPSSNSEVSASAHEPVSQTVSEDSTVPAAMKRPLGL
mmetsp:Transcript_43911/g.113049  ORF Transcript_43911/g.113049 Transcript_43911/m.113049 type:complete len:253 (-) Transcript_43911:349-1107(-)